MNETAEFLAKVIIAKLEAGKRVLWFATGGSSIPVAVAAAKIITGHSHANLTVTLTDERYGDVGHAESNWQRLLEAGFDLPEAKLLPVLSGKSMKETVRDFNDALNSLFVSAEYKIGLFGIGADGHTAGILPESEAVDSPAFVVGYHSANFERITMTPLAIAELDEAIIFTKGEEKWPVLEDFKKDIEISKQPAQILKSIPLLTIFSDKK